MRGRKLAISTSIVAAALSTFALTPTAAYADYAPSADDVVGVGSDTLQAGINFIADGDHTGITGYNAGNPNKFISFDATADANTRLAYGANGTGTGQCTPGTGTTQGTGNANSTHGDTPCTLNPTIVLRAGTRPVQRPNGSGGGYTLLKNDLPNASHLIDFARSSSAQGTFSGLSSITIGTDPLGMLTSSTTSAQRGLSLAELKSIYLCTTTDWGQVGGTAGQTILPLLPQLGSGTRTYFLRALNSSTTTALTPGSCVQNVEENDPEAIDATGANAKNAIEPMSQSRLNLFQGKLDNGNPNGAGGYFTDPSCVALTTSTNAGCQTANKTLNPNVKLWTSANGNNPDTYYPTRNLYLYFRDADINSNKPFEPGSTLNWVRTMLYNPGGATPYVCDTTAAAALQTAGITPNPNCATSYIKNGA